MKVECKKSFCKVSEVPLSSAFVHQGSIYVKCEPFQKNGQNLICIKSESLLMETKCPYITLFPNEDTMVELLDEVVVTF